MKLVLAIDGSNWVHRAWHTPGTGPNRASVVFCQMLAKADRTLGPSHLVVAFDYPGKTWRHELFPAYKAGREEKSDDLVKQLALASQAAQAYGCQVFCIEGVEADDVLATVATRATAAGVGTIIGSGDKDMMQLCSGTVKLLDANYNVLGPEQVEVRWGVRPEKLADVLALMGDSVDGIPGVDGIGAVTAAELVAKYGFAMGAVEHWEDVGGKRGSALGASAEMVKLGLQLVRLKTDVDLGCMLTATRRTPEAFAEFRRKLEHVETSKTVACYGVCNGDPTYRTSDGYACSLCGGSGKVTSYNDRLTQAKDWDLVNHKESV